MMLNLSLREDERREATAQRAYERELDSLERRRQAEADERAREDDREFRRVEREEQEASSERMRAEDRAARAAEREDERARQYAAEMRRQWLSLVDAITRFSWARPHNKPSLLADLTAEFTLTGALAKGQDREVFDVLADRFMESELLGDTAHSVSSILALYARDGMPAAIAVRLIEEAADTHDAAKEAPAQEADHAE